MTIYSQWNILPNNLSTINRSPFVRISGPGYNNTIMKKG